MMTFLLLMLGVVVVAGMVWHFRRQAAAREAASAERMKAFLEQARAEAGARPPGTTPLANTTPAPAATPVAAKGARATPTVALNGFVLRAPMLDAQQVALYQLMKSAMPEHEIFAGVSLAAFVQCADNITGFAREAQERRLADVLADFVVCDLSMHPLAAVQCGARSGKAAERAVFAAACTTASGVRWVEIAPQPLPPPDEIRARVLGQ